MPKVILMEKDGPSTSALTLQYIEITTPPTKTSYLAGDTFDNTGMVIKGYYGVGNTIVTQEGVLITKYSVTPDPLIDGTTAITIVYTEAGVTYTTIQTVTVTHKLVSITLDSLPAATTYEYSSNLDTTGMVVRAHYSDNTSSIVSDVSCSPTTFTTLGSQQVTINYTENEVTKTAIFTVTVNRKQVPEPSWTGTLIYNGNTQSVASTSMWSDYNITYMDIGGTTSGVNAASYNATFTAKSNYCFSNNATSVTKTWSIGKKTLTPTVTGPTNTITASALTQYISISGLDTYYTGAITATASPSTGVTIGATSGTGSNKSISVTGDGSTGGTFNITVNFGNDSNYNAISNQSVSVSAKYWEWGDQTAVGDSAWWAGLKATLSGMTTQQKKDAYLGKTKRMALGGTYLGSTHVLMRCVGCDQDGSNTLAFNAVYALKDTTTFGSNAVWIDSTARSTCQNIYNTCGAKASIKTVKKGTCPNTNNSRNDTPTYNDETVFILSEKEYGLDTYAPISTANSTTSKSECTQGYNESYQYFDGNDKRIMYRMNDAAATAASSNYAYQWERSRFYDTDISDFVCIVGYGGGADLDYYNSSGGLAPAFVIG